MSKVLIIIAIVCLSLLFMGLVGWQYVNLTKSVIVIDVSLSDNEKIDEEGNVPLPAADDAADDAAAPAAATPVTSEQQCKNFKSSSTCTSDTACKWNDRYWTRCSGNGRLGWDCAYFKNVENSSSKCGKAPGCTVRKERKGNNDVFVACDGNQKGEDKDEIICSGRGSDRCAAASPFCQSNFHPAECILK